VQKAMRPGACSRASANIGASLSAAARPDDKLRESRSIEKARSRSSSAGFENSCDDENMPLICPTCQSFSITGCKIIPMI
jgi:hypothetical protein